MNTLEIGKVYKNIRGNDILIIKSHEVKDYFLGIPLYNKTIFCVEINDWVPYTDLEDIKVYNQYGHFGYNNKNPEQLIVEP